jgi:hypothetical protein
LLLEEAMNTKLVTLHLLDLTYEGQSIGSNLTVEAELSGQFVSVNKKVAVGQTVNLNCEIGQFQTAGNEFLVAGTVRVMERDPVFNDLGQTKVNFRFPIAGNQTQDFELLIPVVETGRPGSEREAVFLVRLRGAAVTATRYISRSKDGWTGVLSEATGAKLALPARLRVSVFKVESKREYITILEGTHRGTRATIKLNADGTSRLEAETAQTAEVKLRYSKAARTLTIGRQTFLTRDYPLRPWAKGVYDIEIPDWPHKGGLRFPEANLAKVWFRVGHSGDRYIHTGAASSGCVTLTERNRWDALCEILMRARKGDGISVGTLTVVD